MTGLPGLERQKLVAIQRIANLVGVAGSKSFCRRPADDEAQRL
jgi:hypothetical protein